MWPDVADLEGKAYQTVKERFLLLFKRPVSDSSYYADYLELKQREGELACDFMDRVKLTVRRANPKWTAELFENAVVERFVAGSESDRLRHWALPKLPTGTLTSVKVVEKASAIQTEARLTVRLQTERQEKDSRGRERRRVKGVIGQPEN